MKKILLLAVGFLFTATSLKLYAQDDIQQVVKEWGKDKKELVRMSMELSAADSVKFWPAYTRYEKDRQKITKERMVILEDYSEHYLDLTNAKADELINRIFKNEAALSKLQQQYYNSMKTTLGAKQAAKFLQIESYISSVLKATLQQNIPIIGELDRLKKSL